MIHTEKISPLPSDVVDYFICMSLEKKNLAGQPDRQEIKIAGPVGFFYWSMTSAVTIRRLGRGATLFRPNLKHK